MGLEAVWQEGAYLAYQVWVWLRHEVVMHPVVFVASVIAIVSAIILYKTEVRNK